MKEKDFFKEVTKDLVVDLKSSDMDRMNKAYARNKIRRKNSVAAAIIIGLISVSTVSVGAYSIHKWAGGMKSYFQVSSEEAAKLSESDLVQFPDENGETKSVIKNGVTISTTQTIVDNYYAYVGFKIEGYEVEPGMEPEFQSIDLNVEGEQVSWCSGAYMEPYTMKNGQPYDKDDKRISKDVQGNILANYMLEDGTLEYHILLYSDGKKGCFMDKNIHIDLSDLGVIASGKHALTVEKEGTWAFDWKLEGDASSREWDTKVRLDNTGAVVTHCEISPISIRAVIDLRNVTDVFAETEGLYASICGVKMKDGTLLTFIADAGSWRPSLDGQQELLFSLNRVIDIEQVESILFFKKDMNRNEPCTIDDFYEVPVL